MRPFSFLILLLLFSRLSAQFNPPGMPPFSYTWHTGGEVCEHMFLGLLRFGPGGPFNSTNLILDDRGDIVWYFQATDNMFDFKVHPTGHLSFFIQGEFVVLDSNFNIETGFICRNGLRTDLHDIIIRPDRHVFLICQEDSTMDLSGMLTAGGLPGDTAATVAGTVIQELDWNGNVQKQWHAFPHFDPTDADTTFFTSPTFLELNHTNSMELAADGRMLLSHRHNNEVTALDWNSGQILWRLGGANNQFALPNDIGLSAQHDARFVSTDQVSILDNGEFHSPPRARGLVYQIDTVNMVATRVREWYAPGYVSRALGSLQVLPGGDALVNFGRFDPFTAPAVRYFRADSTPVLSIDFEDYFYTYRARCLELPFEMERPEIRCEVLGNAIQLSVAGSHSQYVWTTGASTSSITVTDTGRYQVFVPAGIGMGGSEVLHITDLQLPCTPVGRAEPGQAATRPPRYLGTFDLLGREVRHQEKGRLYIERYDGGKSRKVVLRD